MWVCSWRWWLKPYCSPNHQILYGTWSIHSETTCMKPYTVLCYRCDLLNYFKLLDLYIRGPQMLSYSSNHSLWAISSSHSSGRLINHNDKYLNFEIYDTRPPMYDPIEDLLLPQISSLVAQKIMASITISNTVFKMPYINVSGCSWIWV